MGNREDVDDYDPRSPDCVLPASDDVLEELHRVRDQQISRLENMVARRKMSGERSKALQHYINVLERLKEEAKADGKLSEKEFEVPQERPKPQKVRGNGRVFWMMQYPFRFFGTKRPLGGVKL